MPSPIDKIRFAIDGIKNGGIIHLHMLVEKSDDKHFDILKEKYFKECEIELLCITNVKSYSKKYYHVVYDIKVLEKKKKSMI